MSEFGWYLTPEQIAKLKAAQAKRAEQIKRIRTDVTIPASALKASS